MRKEPDKLTKEAHPRKELLFADNELTPIVLSIIQKIHVTSRNISDVYVSC